LKIDLQKQKDMLNVVRYHHRPQGLSETSDVVNLVQVADANWLMAGVGVSLDALSNRPSSHAMGRLGLQLKPLDEILYKMLDELLKVRTLFKFRPGSSQ
jgi:hypothetical protein